MIVFFSQFALGTFAQNLLYVNKWS